jgi:signal transduction histidine kinase
VKILVDRLGGAIELISQVNVGSEFIIILPSQSKGSENSGDVIKTTLFDKN